MKMLRIIFAFAVLSGFAINTANAQATVIKDQQWYFFHGSWYYESTDAHEVYCPDGTMNFIVTFKLDLDDPWVPEKGEGVAQYYVSGGWLYVHSNGKAKWYYHYDPLL